MQFLCLLFLLLFDFSRAGSADYDSYEWEDDEKGLSIPEDAKFRPSALRPKGARSRGRLDVSSNWCYCNYPDGICDREGTCVKDDHAACYHATEEKFNKETRQMEKWHRFGCATLELGSDASHLTCNSWRSSHRRPRSIACCYEGEYCNRNLTLPAYAGVFQFEEVLDSGLVIRRPSPLLLIFLAGLGVSILLAATLSIAYLLHRKRTSQKKKTLVLMENDDYDKQPMLDDEGSGSGSGLATLNQRTVALDLTIIKVIGRGRYGEVRKATYRGSYVAVKTFYTTDEESWKNERDVYQTQMLNHENILQFVAADIRSEDSITQMLLITDYHELGSLCDYLRRDCTLETREAIQLAYSAACGLEHLHTAVLGTGSRKKPAIAHRDLKAKNILVKRPGVCCIADFGLAVRWEENRLLPERVNIQVGTKRYMAPEVLNRSLRPSNFSSFTQADMYSFALVMWEVARRIECYQPLFTEASVDGQPAAGSESGIGSSLSQGSDGHGRYVPYVAHPKTSIERFPTALPYIPPFEDLVAGDPSIPEMRDIVCTQQRRPPIEDAWKNGAQPCLVRMTRLMQDCWNPNPACRHSSLKVKMELRQALEEADTEHERTLSHSSNHSSGKKDDSGRHSHDCRAIEWEKEKEKEKKQREQTVLPEGPREEMINIMV